MELGTVVMNVIGPLTPVLVTLAFITPLISKLTKSEKKAPFIFAMIGGLYAVLSTTIVLYYVALEEKPFIYKYGGWPPHFGIVYEIDLFNALLAALVAWLMLPIILYSNWYTQYLDEASWYYTLLLGLETGILGCLYTGDAFNLFVMLEVLSISTYGLVAYHRNRAEAVEAAAKYALIGAVATTMYFVVVVLLYSGFSTVNMAYLALLSSVLETPSLKYVSLVAVSLALWTFTFKSAIFPNHFWLVDANPEAPTPISAALSGLVESVGIYAVARFLYTIFGERSVLIEYREVILIVLLTLGAISGVVCSLMMMYQRDIKRLLAYSAISHTGIIYMGLSAGFLISEDVVEIAMTGTLVHIMSHCIAKVVLFMASGVFIETVGSRDLDEMSGIGKVYPLTSAAMIISFLSLTGLIPFIGFYSKLLIALGYISAGFVLVPVLIIVITALSIPGYMKVISSVIFSVPRRTYGKPDRSSWVEVMLLLMAISLLVLGVIFWYIMPTFEKTALSLIKGVDIYVQVACEKIPGELWKWLPLK